MRYCTPSEYTIYGVHRCPQEMGANEHVIESLVPRIMALSASLCKPVCGGDSKEGMRREELEQ